MRKCLQRNKFSFIYRRRKYLSFVADSVNRTKLRVAIAGSHFTISVEDQRLMVQECEQIFYLTSTRTIRERLMSLGKHTAAGSRVAENATLSEKQMKRAFQIAKTSKSVELNWERSKFRSNHPFTPDYIIRREYFREDLMKLLDALSCEDRFRSSNVHSAKVTKQELLPQKAPSVREQMGRTAEVNVVEDVVVQDVTHERDDKDDMDGDEPLDDDDSDVVGSELEKEQLPEFDLRRIPIYCGDKLHKNFMKLAAKNNAKGLERAVKFRYRYEASKPSRR